MSDVHIRYSVCRNSKDNHPIREGNDWPGFVRLLNELASEAIRGTGKEACKAKAMGICPCWFSPGRRLKVNAGNASFLWLDLEGGDLPSFESVLSNLDVLGLDYVGYTSAGHRIEEPRYRIVFPIATAMAPNDYGRAWAVAVDWLGNPPVDTTKRHPVHMAFQPAIYESAEENLFWHQPGDVLTAEEWLMTAPDESPDIAYDVVDRAAEYRAMIETWKPRPGRRYLSDFVRQDWVSEYCSQRRRSGAHGHFTLLCKIALSAVSQGYPISTHELAEIFWDIDLHAGANYRLDRNIIRESGRAIDFAISWKKASF